MDCLLFPEYPFLHAHGQPVLWPAYHFSAEFSLHTHDLCPSFEPNGPKISALDFIVKKQMFHLPRQKHRDR